MTYIPKLSTKITESVIGSHDPYLPQHIKTNSWVDSCSSLSLRKSSHNYSVTGPSRASMFENKRIDTAIQSECNFCFYTFR